MTRRKRRGASALALGSLLLLAGPLRAAGEQAGGGADRAPALLARDEMRQRAGCLVAPTADSGRELAYHGRPSLEIKGHERGGDGSGALLDLAVYGQAAGRVVSYVCFNNASTRRRGEGIVSLAEVSSRGDRLVRAIYPGAALELESIRRYRPDATESVYYEARYASPAGEFPFLEPPVRLLLNATGGSLFRLDADPDWLNPANPPRARISRKAAERIAAAMLRDRDLEPAFGPGADFGKVATAEIFTVHPNDWLGFFQDGDETRARLAWVVPFRVVGAAAVGLHSLFVDAATGRILGGIAGQAAASSPD